MEKEGGKRIIISTIYKGKAVKVAITKLSPDKLILLAEEPADKTRKEAIEGIKKTFKDIIEIETLTTKVYDMPEIIKDVIKKIEEETKLGNEIIVHISEGRKLTSLALLFAAYLRKDKVKAAYYITEEENRLVSLPLINFSLGSTKQNIIHEIGKGAEEVETLIKKLDVRQSVIYQHIQELKKEGYLKNGETKKLELTELGRIVNL
jgi:CRISPR locus-related DNA-binding protein